MKWPGKITILERSPQMTRTKNNTDSTPVGANPRVRPSLDTSPVQTCRICGCTDDDCQGCIDRTGQPCTWVEEDLCSACIEENEKFENNYNKLMEIIDEEVTYAFFYALENHPPYPSYHHGFAVIKEELDELWEEVRKKNWDKAAMRKEVIHVVTTGLRFYFDLLCDDEEESVPSVSSVPSVAKGDA
jgi:hypothetical protein